MKCRIWPDELHPVYIPDVDFGTEHDVPDALIERWNAAYAEFNAVQEELRLIYEAAESAPTTKGG